MIAGMEVESTLTLRNGWWRCRCVVARSCEDCGHVKRVESLRLHPPTHDSCGKCGETRRA